MTNVFECFCKDEWVCYLRLCGGEERFLSDEGSDYEKWCEICRLLPLTKGSGIRESLSEYLMTQFGICEPINEEYCEDIWKKVADRLLEVTPKKLLTPLGKATDEIPHSEDLIKISSAFANGDRFQSPKPSCRSFSDWQNFVRAETGKDNAVLLSLDPGDRFDSPNPFLLEQMLQGKTPFRKSYFTVQLLRIFSEEHVPVLLKVECLPQEAVKLFDYLQTQKKFPKIYWTASREEVIKDLIAYQSKMRERKLHFAVFSDEINKKPTLLQKIAKVYPIGILYEINSNSFLK